MPLAIPYLRLLNQQLSRSCFQDPTSLVAWLGAVQAQDYAGAKWALGLRLPGSTEAAIERAFDQGAILRTHVMRPTWHFVTPADIRWMLALTAARVHAYSAYYYRRMELDAPIFARANGVLEKALRGGNQLTRPELESILRQAGILTDELRFTYLIMHAELDGVLCSGARRGKQFTYALLEERVPAAGNLDREAALAELARRYFQSHGPATVADFSWWSGLSAAEALSGLELVKSNLMREDVGGRAHWLPEPGPAPALPALPAFLLPNYDEYTVAYADRGAISLGIDLTKLDNRTQGLLNNTILLGGQVAGNWKRAIRKDSAALELKPYRPLNEVEYRSISEAAQRYGDFLGLPVTLPS